MKFNLLIRSLKFVLEAIDGKNALVQYVALDPHYSS